MAVCEAGRRPGEVGGKSLVATVVVDRGRALAHDANLDTDFTTPDIPDDT